MKAARLPPPFPAGASPPATTHPSPEPGSAPLVAAAPSEAPAPSPAASGPEDIIDLGADLIEDFHEEVTVQAPLRTIPKPVAQRTIPKPVAQRTIPKPVARRAVPKPPEPPEPPELVEDFHEEVTVQAPQRTVPKPPERRPTRRSRIPAQLAESMAALDDEHAPAAIPVREHGGPLGTGELTLPNLLVDAARPTGAGAAPGGARDEPALAQDAAAPDPAPAPDSITSVGEEEGAPDEPPMDAAAPMAAIHDEVTLMVASARPASREQESSAQWIELVAEPSLSMTSGPWGRATLVLPPPRLLGSLDLRGVFSSDGAAIAADPALPDEIFMSSARERPRAATSSMMPGSRGSSIGTSATAGVARRTTHGAAGASGATRPRSQDGRPGARGSEPGARGHRVSGRRSPEETLPRGAIIDKYRIDRLLGKGGFAAVYRATHLMLNTQVAIKLLRPQVLARHAHLAKLLYEEARFAARIDHPNVVKVFDVTHSPSITYIVMEYIEGRSLAETLSRDRALPWPRVVEIGMAVAAGLKVALEAHLIHRDIKPANILLGKRGEIKIVDLGLVLRAGATTPDPSGHEPAAGRRSAIGTFGYMAPEQAVDPERVDFRADIYSLGATLYEAAVGGPPFPLGDAARCVEMHAHEPPPSPETRRPGLPPELSALLLRMLAKKPEDRFDSYDALLGALRALAAQAVASR